MKKTFTTYNGKDIYFDVIVDETFHNLALDEVDPNKKALFSLVNDYEGGAWRLKKFESFLWDNIKETALSATEKEALIGSEHSSLTKSAGNVRFEKKGDNKGGEIGEILLYGIMRHYYSALPVVPKIFYKQNVNDYAKGADSVHIIIEEDGSYSFWLGEAKFYNTSDKSRFDTILASVKCMLDSSKLRKEFNIVTSTKDLELLVNNKEILGEIQKTLEDGVSLDDIKKRLHIPILLLHECEITKNHVGSFNEYKKAIKQEHLKIAQEFIKKQDTKLGDIYGYSDICFHFILFPVHSKDIILNRFMGKVDFLKKGE